MTQDLIGAAYDALYILLFWTPGVLTALLLGARKISQVLPLGFLFSALSVSIIYSAVVVAQSPEAFWITSRIIFAIGAVGLGLVVLKKRPEGIVWSGVIMAAITGSAVVARNIFRLDVRPQYSDQFVVGWISSLLQSGADPTLFGSVSALKRSFIFPLALSVGREGTILISLVSITAVLLVMATYHLVRVLTTNVDGRIRLGVFFGVMVLWATSSFFWAMFGYQNAHVLVALAVSVLLFSVFNHRHRGESPWLGSVGAFVAGFVVAQSRIEAVALALLLMVPLLFFADRKRKQDSRRYLTPFFGPLLGFSLWLLTTGAFVFDLIPAIALIGLFIPFIALLVFPQYSKRLGQILLPGLLGIFIALTIWYLFLVDGGPGRRAQFFTNTFLGDGMWGYGAWAFLAIILVTSVRRMSHRDILLLWVTGMAILFTIDVKVVDGLIEAGGITGFGRGWTDSTNRAFFHLFGPLTAAMAVGIIRIASSARDKEATRLEKARAD